MLKIFKIHFIIGSVMVSVFFILTFFAGVNAEAQNQGVFYRNLSFGDTGEDVLALQKLLNLSVDTKVGDTGPGSLGLETRFFGSATKNGVIRFQNKYAAEILHPANLTSGTGFVGEFTRKKLNSILLSSTPTIPISSEALLPIFPLTPIPGGPIIKEISPTSGKNLTEIKIMGEGFDLTNNTVLVSFENSQKYTGIFSDGKIITFKMNSIISEQLGKKIKSLSSSGKQKVFAQIPASIPIGVAVQTSKGTSNIVTFDLLLHENE